MSWHHSQKIHAPVPTRPCKAPSSSSLGPAAAPAPNPFLPSPWHHEQHGSRRKNPTPDTGMGNSVDADDARKRRRLLLEMDDWTGAKARKPLAMHFPRADPDAPAWGWSRSSQAEVAEKESHGPRSGSASYSVQKYSPTDMYSYPSSSSTLQARPSHQPQHSLRTALASLTSSPGSQPVSGTLSEEERHRFESDGVGILSPSGPSRQSGQTVGSALVDLPVMSGALPAPAHLQASQASGDSPHASGRDESCASSFGRVRTPSEVPEGVFLGSDEGSYGQREGEEEEEGGEEEEDEEEADDIQLVPSDGPVEEEQRTTPQKRARGATALVQDPGIFSEASRAAGILKGQRVTIREIPNCNDSDDPIEDSESELEMLRRAAPMKTTRGGGGGRGRGARGAR